MGSPLRAVENEAACCPACTWRARYARDVADALRLRDWTVEVVHGPPLESGLAECIVVEGRQVVQIRFRDDFDALSPEDRRHVLVHELAHVLFDRVYVAATATARDHFSKVAYEIYERHLRLEVERAVDAVASVVAPAVSLPPGV